MRGACDTRSVDGGVIPSATACAVQAEADLPARYARLGRRVAGSVGFQRGVRNGRLRDGARGFERNGSGCRLGITLAINGTDEGTSNGWLSRPVVMLVYA